MELVIIGVVLAVVLGMVLLIGRALGGGHAPQKFDETPADVIALDTSDGTPIDLSGWNANMPTKMSPEEQELASREFERLSAHLNEGRR